MFVKGTMNRRTCLMLGGVALTGVVFTSVTGCGEEGEESSRVTMTSESAQTGDSQQTVEISTPRGTVHGVLYPVEGARGAAVMVGGAGAASDAVVGVATVASQTYGAKAVGELSPEKSMLLIHGTADRVLPYELSERLYAQAGEPKELVLYPDDGHGVERHRLEMLEKLHEWSRNLLFGDSETRAGEG
jgi:pimeloyl-ACP methyl ester carboxylesterase